MSVAARLNGVSAQHDQQPEAMRDVQIISISILVEILPEPVRGIIGDLSDCDRALAGPNSLSTRAARDKDA